MSDDTEETNSGLKKKGTWKEVAEFGAEVEEAIKDQLDEVSLEEFEEWRPKEEEAENDMKRKTVNKAVINKNKLEVESDGVREDLMNATEKVAKASKKAAHRKAPAQEITEASEDVAKPFYSRIAGFFRKFEKLIYSKIALRNDTYYFDSQGMSVDMKSVGDEYELDVNVPIKDQREKLKEEFMDDE